MTVLASWRRAADPGFSWRLGVSAALVAGLAIAAFAQPADAASRFVFGSGNKVLAKPAQGGPARVIARLPRPRSGRAFTGAVAASPSGRKLVVVRQVLVNRGRRTFRHGELFAMRADGSRVRFIRRLGTGSSTSIDINRYGRILFNDYSSHILVMRGDGSHIREYGSGIDAEFLPSGRAIIFNGTSGPNIFIRRLSGGARRVVGEGYSPTVSPNGRLIAFKSYRSDPLGLGNIWLMRRDGSGARQLTAGDPATEGQMEPAFAPNGRAVAYVQINNAAPDSTHVRAIRIDGTNDHRVAGVLPFRLEWARAPR